MTRIVNATVKKDAKTGEYRVVLLTSKFKDHDSASIFAYNFMEHGSWPIFTNKSYKPSEKVEHVAAQVEK